MIPATDGCMDVEDLLSNYLLVNLFDFFVIKFVISKKQPTFITCPSRAFYRHCVSVCQCVYLFLTLGELGFKF